MGGHDSLVWSSTRSQDVTYICKQARAYDVPGKKLEHCTLQLCTLKGRRSAEARAQHVYVWRIGPYTVGRQPGCIEDVEGDLQARVNGAYQLLSKLPPIESSP